MNADVWKHGDPCGVCLGPLELSTWLEDGELFYKGQREILDCGHSFHIYCVSGLVDQKQNCPLCTRSSDNHDKDNWTKITERKAAIDKHLPTYLAKECQQRRIKNIDELETAYKSADGARKEKYAQQIFDIYTSADAKMMDNMNKYADFQNRLEDGGYPQSTGLASVAAVNQTILMTLSMVIHQLAISSSALQTSPQNTDVHPSGAATGTTNNVLKPAGSASIPTTSTHCSVTKRKLEQQTDNVHVTNSLSDDEVLQEVEQLHKVLGNINDPELSNEDIIKVVDLLLSADKKHTVDSKKVVITEDQVAKARGDIKKREEAEERRKKMEEEERKVLAERSKTQAERYKQLKAEPEGKQEPCADKR